MTSLYGQEKQTNLTTLTQNDSSLATEQGTSSGKHIRSLDKMASQRSNSFFRPSAAFIDNLSGKQGNEKVLSHPLVRENTSLSNRAGEGCLNSEFGQYPEETYVPSCIGIIERITTIGWAGEYSKVQVSAGTAYIFSSSMATDFITIADEEGAFVFATGTGAVSWTSPNDQVIRFYNHADEECSSEEVSRTRGVQCGEIPVYDPCAPVFKGGDDIGIGFSNGFVAANDINVLANKQFSVKKIILEVATFKGDPTTFTVAFHEGEAGVETQYGKAFENLVPTSIINTGLFGLISKYKVELTLPTPLILPGTAQADKKYWVSVASEFSTTGDFTYWLGSDYSSTNTLPMWQLPIAEGSVWKQYVDDSGNTFEGIMSIEGDCEELLGVSDVKSSDFKFYPNPVKDILTFSTKKSVENVSIFNLAGQQVLKETKVNNGQININSLVPGIYLFKVRLSEGKVETFKIIKE